MKMPVVYLFIICMILMFYETLQLLSNAFCMALCVKNQCNTIANTGCTSCLSGFQLLSGSQNNCVVTIPPNLLLNSIIRYQPVGKSSDITLSLGGNAAITTLSVKLNGVAANPTATCNKDATYYYTFYQASSSTDVISVSCSAVTGNLYYWKVRIIYWVITIDQWDTTSVLTTTFSSNTTSTALSTSLSNASMAAAKAICSNPAKDQNYQTVDKEWAYSAATAFNFALSISGNSQNNPWGVKQFTVLIRLCHPYCSVCTGDDNNQCTACDYTGTGARLSGNTCALTCPLYYGINTAVPAVCVACGINCQTCLDNATNCLTCDATYYILNNGVASTCILTCPGGYIANNVPTIPLCIACSVSCLTCSLVITNCTSCYTTPTIKYLVNNACYTTCPAAQTYGEAATQTCQPCLNLCSACSIISTNCSACDTTGSYIAFLLGSTCLTTCGSGYIDNNNLGVGPNICTPCTSPCLTCSLIATNCTSCIITPTKYYLYNNLCYSPCPAQTYSDNGTQTCQLCLNLCSTCSVSPTNCSACDTTGPYISFLLGSTCLTNCGSLYISDTNSGSGPNICISCASPCLTCSLLTTDCTTCITTPTKYYLYNNVCYNPCPAETYSDNGTQSCLLCLNLCSVCSVTSTNCSACDTAGPYISYLLGSTCVTNCGNNYISNTNNGAGPNVCIICISPCLTCSLIATNCTSCIIAPSIHYLYNHVCYDPCPAETYSDISNQLCYPCLNLCSICSISSLNCSACDTIGPYTSYLLGSSCVINCGNTYVADTNFGSGPNTCILCDNNCLTCTNLRTNCTSCPTIPTISYLHNNICYNPCPGQTFLNSSSQTCESCNDLCLLCDVILTNCSACQTTGLYTAFLFGTTCLATCDTGYFQDTNTGLGPNVCSLCDVKCLTCDFNSTYCYTCAKPYVLSGNSCQVAVQQSNFFIQNYKEFIIGTLAAALVLTIIYFVRKGKNLEEQILRVSKQKQNQFNQKQDVESIRIRKRRKQMSDSKTKLNRTGFTENTNGDLQSDSIDSLDADIIYVQPIFRDLVFD